MSAEPLAASERARLRRLAHPLKPVMQIGRDGVSEAAIAALQEAFHTRDLLKVRVLPSAPGEVRKTANALASRIEGAVVVQTVGHVAVLFRALPEEHG